MSYLDDAGERRAHPRGRCRNGPLPVFLSWAGQPPRAAPAVLMDLGEGGALALSRFAPSQGGAVVRLVLPGARGVAPVAAVTVDAPRRRLGVRGDSARRLWLTGLRFLGPCPPDLLRAAFDVERRAADRVAFPEGPALGPFG